MTQLTRLLHIVCLLCACNMAYAQNTIRSRHRPKPRKVTVTQTPLRKYINQKKEEIAKQQAAERKCYETACKTATRDALEKYLERYPKGKYVADVRNRIADFKLWDKAKEANTIAACQEYLRMSQFRFFEQQARSTINNLEAAAAWNAIKLSAQKSDIYAFISKYPDASCVADAYRRIHELDGLAHFRQQQYEQALNEFNLAGGEQALSPASLPCYKQAQEYVDYTSARNRNTEGALRSFLTNYPYSCYSKEISNLLALAIAQSITIYSYNSAGAEALSYAKDSSTRQAVQRYIDWQKKNYKLYCKRNRMAARRANGNIIQFGLEWMDVGFNPSCYDDTDNDLDIVWFYNVGLGLKFGNYNTPVQFLLGAKIGLVGYTVWYDYNDESKTCFHLPLFAKLKVNVCNISKSAKLFVDATGYFNAVRDEFIENKFAASCGIGTAWKHWDWSFYYKADLSNKRHLDNDYLATSISYYF